ncbi:hypothetical protein KI387_037876 [Taxus chinensis]|uniref:Uncharacterized protein n=1 Tax=Taxus chinensis TaxID=29808 RepID=A0AA38L6S7_TAXCH|nr:hypothetical protein KI387_037876 [Taxus chinensis]
MLKGTLPSSLQNCSMLQILDMTKNLFFETIPHWFGQFPKLRILVLKSNKFQGRIPHQLSNLSSLHVLDISDNNLIGGIPLQLATLTALKDPQVTSSKASGDTFYYREEVQVTIKEMELVYHRSILLLITCIDLSSNQLSGDIPSEFGNLKGLRTLNLSRNSLTGRIPVSFGMLEQLESLDLSNNKLNGRIPNEMLQATSLSFFIVSNNTFCGRIPVGRQFSTFKPTFFSGNPSLCGFPLDNISCGCEQKLSPPMLPISPSRDEEKEEEIKMPWYWYVSWMASYALGFWGVFVILFMKKRLRGKYIEVMDGIVIRLAEIFPGRN